MDGDLKSLAEQARDQAKRVRLVQDQVPLAAGRLLHQYVEGNDFGSATSHASSPEAQNVDILSLLRLLRNLCASGQASADQLHLCGTATYTARLLSTQPRAQIQGDNTLCLLAVQLLANLAATGRQGQADVWEAAYPAALENSLQACNVHPLSRILERCCSSSQECAAQLCGSSGAHLLSFVVEQSTISPHMDEMGDLIVQLVVVHGQLEAVMAACDSCADSQASRLHVLRLLSQEISQIGDRKDPDSLPGHLDQSVHHLAAGMQQNLPQCTAGSPAADALQASLEVLQAVFARDDGGAGLLQDCSAVSALKYAVSTASCAKSGAFAGGSRAAFGTVPGRCGQPFVT
ncbi:hypothetical protein WJX73_002940 [Symbiochloris irregularis]|uniref:Wings apart-like protein C-terminal domain-containing protein n=1 Tax=Symbiochloris irregularis TaxID=706552 RepID=A0AAW1PET8_9CHLO